MSALGQKRTFRNVAPMSALPPKADMDQSGCDVRFVPKADSCTAAINAKLKRGSAYRQLARLIPVWTKSASRHRGPSSNRPPVSSARSHGQQLAYVCYENENGRRSNGSTITNLLWN